MFRRLPVGVARVYQKVLFELFPHFVHGLIKIIINIAWLSQRTSFNEILLSACLFSTGNQKIRELEVLEKTCHKDQEEERKRGAD